MFNRKRLFCVGNGVLIYFTDKSKYRGLTFISTTQSEKPIFPWPNCANSSRFYARNPLYVAQTCILSLRKPAFGNVGFRMRVSAKLRTHDQSEVLK